MRLTVTHKDGMDNIDIPLKKDDRSQKINEFWDLSINGKLKNVRIDYLKIENISVEYVVSEREYYVNYEVGHYQNDTLVTICKLTYDDIKEYF